MQSRPCGKVEEQVKDPGSHEIVTPSGKNNDRFRIHTMTKEMRCLMRLMAHTNCANSESFSCWQQLSRLVAWTGIRS